MAAADDAILSYLDKNEVIADSGVYADEQGLSHNEVFNVIKSLHGSRFVDAEDIKKEKWVLTDEGAKYAAEGSPEMQLFLALPEEGSISKDELQRKLDPAVFKIGCSQAAKNKWLVMGKQVSRKVQHVEDKVKQLLLQINDEKDANDMEGLLSEKRPKFCSKKKESCNLFDSGKSTEG